MGSVKNRIGDSQLTSECLRCYKSLEIERHEFGLDVIAWVGTLRYAQHRSLPEIHQHLRSRGVAVAPRTVTHLLERYDELLTLSLTDTTRLQRITQAQGRVIL